MKQFLLIMTWSALFAFGVLMTVYGIWLHTDRCHNGNVRIERCPK